jgi:signal transduction histidine kinase
MNARGILARVLLVNVNVPLSAALVYVLVVPVFLGREESARVELFRETALVTFVTILALLAFALRSAGAIVRATRVLQKSPQKRIENRDIAILHAVSRNGTLVLALVALVLLTVAIWMRSRHESSAISVVFLVGTAFVITASLVLYPATRRALRPLFERLAPPESVERPALGDRLTLRVCLAVAVPSGVAALLAALLVTAHVSATAHEQEEFDARVLTVALGVRRLANEGTQGRLLAARVLSSHGARVTTGVELPIVESMPVATPSFVGPLCVGLLFACVGAILGLRTGRRASRELLYSTHRVETVGMLQLSMSPRESIASLSSVRNAIGLSLPDVRAISLALDRLTEALATIARDQRRAVTARAEAARLRSFVLAGVSHDLRGPLNSILGFSDLLLSGVDGEVSSGQRESLDALTRSGRDLLRLVDDLLDAAKLDAGRMTLQRVRVSVRSLLHEAVAAARERVAGAMDVPMDVPMEGELELVAALDRERMVHHLGTLIAYAYLRQGASALHGPAVSLRVRAMDEAMLLVVVSSHGTTPSPEALAQLFAPFDLPPSGARAPGGLGLSLGVCRRVIELHGGLCLAEALSQGGIALRVTLPRARTRSTGRSNAVSKR